jgi:hypothetical protein
MHTNPLPLHPAWGRGINLAYSCWRFKIMNDQLAPASNSDTSSDISDTSTDTSNIYININVEINDGIIFIWKMVYISVKYVPLPFIPVSVVAADMTQAYLRKTDSISSKIIHKIFPGQKNLQMDDTPSIDDLMAEAKYTTETKEFQVVETSSRIPPPA